MRRRQFARASVVALAGLIGCGIDALGTATLDGGASPPAPASTTSVATLCCE